jgi:hypothetical protein
VVEIVVHTIELLSVSIGDELWNKLGRGGSILVGPLYLDQELVRLDETGLIVDSATDGDLFSNVYICVCVCVCVCVKS